MKTFFFYLSAVLALCGVSLVPASVAVGKGKSGSAIFRSSSSGRNSAVSSNMSNNSRRLSVTSNKLSSNLSSSLSSNAMSGKFKSSRNLGTKNYAQSLNGAMGNQLATGALQRNNGIGRRPIAGAIGTQNDLGNLSGLQGGANAIANRGAIQNAIQTGGLTAVNLGNNAAAGTNLGGRLRIADQSTIADAIQGGAVRPIGDGTRNPPPSDENGGLQPIGDGGRNGIPDISDDTGGGSNGENNRGNQNPPPSADGGGTVNDGNSNTIQPTDPPSNETPPVDPNDPVSPPKVECDKKCDYPWWSFVFDNMYVGGNCGPVATCPPTCNVTVIEQGLVTATYPAAVQPVQPVAVPAVDLELVDVRIVDSGDASKKLGPRYRVAFRNVGTLPAGNFQLAAMASRDGKPAAGMPLATAEIVGLAVGEVASVDVRLPASPDLGTMPRLIVALDTATQIVESDEQNNVVVLDRTKIATVDAAAVANVKP